jgi:3'-phosphoadenosine 5'-phosphosulfate sulfotransferase (PAPS reductase)/FAD synthetase
LFGGNAAVHKSPPKTLGPQNFPFELRLPAHLQLTGAQVGRLTAAQRLIRISDLTELSGRILDDAIDLARTHMTGFPGRERDIAGIVGMFSGGNDSTVLAHLLRGRLTHLGHANTGIGITATRQFVRATAAQFGLPLIEKQAARGEDSYRALVLARGFPGPGQHYLMYQRLKERAFAAMRNDLVANGRHQRVVFAAGRRRDESSRRLNVPELERVRAVMWVSPLVLWTKLDMGLYRRLHDVPVNEVTSVLHMSGECLCGSFAKRGELEWLQQWYPEDAALALIRELEYLLENRADIPVQRRTWGWGAYAPNRAEMMARARSGRLCAACPAGSEEQAALFTGG